MSSTIPARERETSLTATSATASATPRPSPVRAILSASSGNLVEWFDFYAYSTTAIYFSASFFPKTDQTSQLLGSAAVFALGFFMRPLGSWLFGRIADRRGRRESMVIAVITMCFGSLLMACLPTYDTIGRAAPALLLLARLIQGLSVGGEYGTAATYMSEVALPGKRGFYASFQYVSLIGGQLLAGVVLVILQQFLTVEELRAWGWRIPFLVGAAAALVALYLRRSLHETTTAETRAKAHAGTIKGILQHPRALLTVIGYTAGGSLTYYTYTVYMQKYLVNTAHFDAKTATNVMTLALFFFMLVQPLYGALSDRIGRRNSMICFSLFGMFATYPLMSALGRVSSTSAAFGLIMVTLLGTSFYSSVSGLVKAEMFPIEVRALAVGLSYAIGNAAFGGTAEYVALWFKQAGNETGFFWYVTAVTGLALIASWLMPDNRRHSRLEQEA